MIHTGQLLKLILRKPGVVVTRVGCYMGRLLPLDFSIGPRLADELGLKKKKKKLDFLNLKVKLGLEHYSFLIQTVMGALHSFVSR